ncbi:MAG: hypothetical protein EBR13_00430 [Rhodobacteraceae bacterium]|nr:hypothetical protein [Paracoccaceae bacterium]
MTRSFALVPMVFALCACALPQANPNPTDIRLSRGDLEVRMSDGTTCTATALERDVTLWQGALEGCRDGFGYVVEIDQRSNVLRRVFELVVKSVAPEAELPPVASVTITDARGQIYEFLSPRPVAPIR